ncbi:hypothetical protein BJV77DRAFT_1045009 [Russula vinacea]|nr:hypothetical protein BJV77DRAFT_1045009 [Russula vinacea]
MSDLPPIPPHIIRITAPLILGGLWNWCLFGVLLVQYYVYSYNFPKDRKRVKLLVHGIFFLEVVQTALSGADLFYWFASGYGNINHLFSPFATPYDGPILESVVSAIVQFFYAYRIWVLSNKRSWWLCLIICLVLHCQLGSRIHRWYLCAYTSKVCQWSKSQKHCDNLDGRERDGRHPCRFCDGLSPDKIRRDSECHFNDNTLVQIVRLTVETNLLTTTVGIVALLVVVIFPNENWYICPTAILGKLYSNTLLVSLNSRISIRGNQNPPVATLSPSIAFAITSNRTGSPTNITLKEIEQPEVVYKASGSMAI